MSFYNPEADPQINGDDFLIGGSFIAGINSAGELECNSMILSASQAITFSKWLLNQVNGGYLNVSSNSGVVDSGSSNSNGCRVCSK